MTARLGDGLDGKAETLGGGPLSDDEYTLGAKGNLFIGLRHARREAMLLGVASVIHQNPAIGISPETPSGSGVGDGGDGGGDGGGGDGGDGG